MTKKITQKDIAKKAGVSVSTVSSVLRGNNLRYISKNTIEKVNSLAKRVGYEKK